jgi:hypothetical protein
MHRSLAALLLGAGVFRLIDGYTITARAVEPTASGEIGVNPPDGLGEQSHYVGWIGVDTDYLSLDGSTTKVSSTSSSNLASSLIILVDWG